MIVPTIVPTVGRVVWFYPDGEQEGKQPLAAIVVYVHSPTCVNLAVFQPDGTTSGLTSIPLVQPEAPDLPGKSYCKWMPFQIGQAAKHGS